MSQECTFSAPRIEARHVVHGPLDTARGPLDDVTRRLVHEVGRELAEHLHRTGQITVDQIAAPHMDPSGREVRVALTGRRSPPFSGYAPDMVSYMQPPAPPAPAPTLDGLAELEAWADGLAENLLGETSGRFVLDLMRTQIARIQSEAKAKAQAKAQAKAPPASPGLEQWQVDLLDLMQQHYGKPAEGARHLAERARLEAARERAARERAAREGAMNEEWLRLHAGFPGPTKKPKSIRARLFGGSDDA